MEIRVLEKNELKLLQKLCTNGENWADVYYRRIELYYTDEVKTFGLIENDEIIAEISVVEDDILSYDSFAKKKDTVHLIDFDVLEEKRQQGYGTALLNYIVLLYKRLGYNRIVITYNDGNAVTEKLASKVGFDELLKQEGKKITMCLNLKKGVI